MIARAPSGCKAGQMSHPQSRFAASVPSARRALRTGLDDSLGSDRDRDAVAALAHAVRSGAISA
jgi:hypothetical protein